MRCQFFETPKKKGKIRSAYTRKDVRIHHLLHIITAKRCPGTMKVRIEIEHNGGYGSCSYQLEVQYYCDTCKKIYYGELPRWPEQIEAIVQQRLDSMTDRHLDRLEDAAEALRKARIEESQRERERLRVRRKRRPK